MQEMRAEESLEQIKRLHKRVITVWNDRKKYMQSMKKSQSYILQINGKQQTEERTRLIRKLRGHIAKVLGEYLPSLEQLKSLQLRSQVVLQGLSSILAYQEPSQQVLLAVEQVRQIRSICMEASMFA